MPTDPPMYFPLPDLPSPVSANQLSSELGIARTGVRELLCSGYVDQLCGATPDSPAAFNVNGAPATTAAALERLLQVKQVEEHEFTLNVRVRAARESSDPDRDVMGWHARLTKEQLDLSIAQWWSEPSRDVKGAAFIATIAGFVVAHGRIKNWRLERGQSSYSIDWDDVDVARQWGGRRVELNQKGGTVVYHESTL